MKTVERATITVPLHEYNKLVNEHADLKAKIAQVEESHDKEIGAFQDEVRNLVLDMSGAPDESIDGKGSDGGWQDLTLAEISQGLAFLKDRLAQVEAESTRRLELLRKCEWIQADSPDEPLHCPVCKYFKHGDVSSHYGHKPDCPLAAELKEAK